MKGSSSTSHAPTQETSGALAAFGGFGGGFGCRASRLRGSCWWLRRNCCRLRGSCYCFAPPWLVRRLPPSLACTAAAATLLGLHGSCCTTKLYCYALSLKVKVVKMVQLIPKGCFAPALQVTTLLLPLPCKPELPTKKKLVSQGGIGVLYGGSRAHLPLRGLEFLSFVSRLARQLLRSSRLARQAAATEGTTTW